MLRGEASDLALDARLVVRCGVDEAARRSSHSTSASAIARAVIAATDTVEAVVRHGSMGKGR